MDHFQLLVHKKQDELAKASIGLPLGDSHRHAEIKGQYQGLKLALDLYKQATQADMDEAA